MLVCNIICTFAKRKEEPLFRRSPNSYRNNIYTNYKGTNAKTKMEYTFEVAIFFILYGASTVISAIACLYLLLRRGNAFAPDITPPTRLRYWAAALLGSISLSHIWWIPDALSSDDFTSTSYIVACMLDCCFLVPVMLGIMPTMLQDRRRPVWPIGVASLPVLILLVVCFFNRSETILRIGEAYMLLMSGVFIVYMLFATRQYRQWLRDNFADLEHKEVWKTLMTLIALLLMLGIYDVSVNNIILQFFLQAVVIVTVILLLLRVETLQTLEVEANETTNDKEALDSTSSLSPTKDNIAPIAVLLRQHCEDTQLYLQHDLTLQQLAAAVGTNRTYLGVYFAQQGINYNAYINGLRIQHFVKLYEERTKQGQPLTAQSLAAESGFKSYATFGVAFKRFMGQTVSSWMKLNFQN